MKGILIDFLEWAEITSPDAWYVFENKNTAVSDFFKHRGYRTDEDRKILFNEIDTFLNDYHDTIYDILAETYPSLKGVDFELSTIVNFDGEETCVSLLDIVDTVLSAVSAAVGTFE